MCACGDMCVMCVRVVTCVHAVMCVHMVMCVCGDVMYVLKLNGFHVLLTVTFRMFCIEARILRNG